MAQIPPLPDRPLAPRLASLLLAAGCCAIAAWWTVQVTAPRAVIAPAAQTSAPPPDPAVAAPLFGAGQVGAPLSSPARLTRIQVQGVVVHAQRSVALLVVEDRPVRAYAVGDTVLPGLTLSAVSLDEATFDRGGERFSLRAPRRSGTDLLSQPRAPKAGP